MSRRLSVALLSHLASPSAPTGAEHSLALLAGGLAQRRHRVAVVAPGPWALADRVREAGAEVVMVRSRPCWMTYWEPRPWPLALAKWLRCLAPQRGEARLAGFLERFRPDVVHVNCLPHVAGARSAARSGRPVVWHLREILPPGRRRRWLAARVARHAAAVVAVSEAVGRWLREEGLGARLHVVPNGVRLPATPPDASQARASLGLEGAGIVVGLYGQLVPHKGALAFIDAARLAAPRDPALRFVLAGTGPTAFRRRCAEAIARSGHAERFRLLPPQASGDALIAASDIVCLATTTPDPFPRVVLEAMAAGRPVAAFDSGGTGEMVVDGETGILVPPGDVPALGSAFARLAADGARRASLGAAGARRVDALFSIERHVDRMEAVLASLCA